MDEEIALAGGEWEEAAEFKGAVGRTMYDAPTSKDGTVTVLTAPENIAKVPSNSLVRVKSRSTDSGGDGRQYLGAVVQGPFAEPDGLRADAPIVVTTTVHGATFTPRYHGRAQVEIMGEEVDGILIPPRFRPRPNSPVFSLDEEETSRVLGLAGDIAIGSAIGYQDLRVAIPSKRKSVLPRHLGILGTTGGGKSTTVSGLIHQFRTAGMATIIIDTEGEYVEINRPTVDQNMVRLLQRLGRKPDGAGDVSVHHLVGRETAATPPTPILPFKVEFSSLSPYAVAEILEFSDAQADRFFKAYDAAKLILRDLKIYPAGKEEEKESVELNEFDSGYPRLTLLHLIDVASALLHKVAGSEPEFYNSPDFRKADGQTALKKRINAVQTNNEISWRSLLGKLWRLKRIDVFDRPGAHGMDFAAMIKPGRISVVDLSDTDSTFINNLVIANILRGLQIAQETAYQEAEKAGKTPTPVMIIIEEAHEFLSRDRISKMENLFTQVARIARRGRKRWLGLTFVTQLPQHLPDEVLALINNFVLHKISDANVISRLRRSIGGIDESMWERLPSLAPGQAIVSATSMLRPMLVAVDPTPCRLRMIE
jgi:DNA helicase HerA-like ATPase